MLGEAFSECVSNENTLERGLPASPQSILAYNLAGSKTACSCFGPSTAAPRLFFGLSFGAV